MVTKVYLIRHGETVDADARRYKGHIDVPLSDNGIEQIKKLSKYLAQRCSTLLNSRSTVVKKPLLSDVDPSSSDVEQGTLKAVYSSGLSRALKSAEIIAEPHRLEPVIVEALKERNFGVWEGMSFDEIREKYPDAFDAWANNPLKFSPMEGESTIDVRERAIEAFNKIVDGHKGEEIAIVSHGGITRVILCELLGIPLENIFRIDQDFGALNVIEFWDYPVVKRINFVVSDGSM